MLTTSIKIYQTLADFAIKNAGNASAAFAIAKQNNVSITDNITPGTLLNYEVAAPLPKNYYSPAATTITEFKQQLKRFQTPLDYATEFAGTADAVIDICRRNNIGITEDVAAGTLLNYQQTDKKTAAYFQKKGIDIVTRESTVVINKPIGVGYWYIEAPDPIFTVS